MTPSDMQDAQRPPYHRLKAVAKPFKWDEYLGGKLKISDTECQCSEFYGELLDRLEAVVARTYDASMRQIEIENLEYMWYYTVRGFSPLIKYIEKVQKKYMQLEPTWNDEDYAVWSFVIHSVNWWESWRKNQE